MTWARLLTEIVPSTFTPASRRAATSFRKAMGSSTTPLPMTLRQPGRNTPQGTSCKMNFLLWMMTVWPALCPPPYRATMEKFSEKTSTILPLPSSPHCAPTMTAVLPFFKFHSMEVSRAAALAALQGHTHLSHPRGKSSAEFLECMPSRCVLDMIHCRARDGQLELPPRGSQSH